MEDTFLNNFFRFELVEMDDWNEVELKLNLKKKNWKDSGRQFRKQEIRESSILFFENSVLVRLHMVNYSEKINGLSILFSSWFNRTSSTSTAIFATSFNTELVNVNDNSILVSRLAVVLRFFKKVGSTSCHVLRNGGKKTRTRIPCK